MAPGRTGTNITSKIAALKRLWSIPALFATLLLIGFIILRWRARRAKRAPWDEEYRLWPDISELQGLSEAEVEERQLTGQANVGASRTSPTRSDIWRSNLFSIFNLNLIALGIALLLLGKPLDALTSVAGALFGIGMNVRQQLKAKEQVDEIAASTRVEAMVVREGKVRSIPPTEIVRGDVLLVGPGDPVFADGKAIGKGQIRVDESALTGKTEHPTKRAGDSLYTGSFCVAGRIAYEAQKVGDERFAAGLIIEEKGTYAELTPLQGLMNHALRLLLVVVAVFVVGFMAVYLFSDTDRVSQFFIDAVSMAFGIAPSGLFFMFIITYAVATANIAKLGAVVYRPQAVEALAYVDVICLGKTSGLIGVSAEMEPIYRPDDPQGLTAAQVRRALGDYAHSTSAASPINRVIADTFSGDRRAVVKEAPFFAAYGWSAVAFDEIDLRGVYVLGETEVLQPHLIAEASETTTRIGEQADADGSKLSALSGFAKRLTGVFRRGEDEDEARRQRPEQKEAQSDDGGPKPPIVTGFAGRLTGFLRQGDRDEGVAARQRPEQKGTQGTDAPSAAVEQGGVSSSNANSESESERDSTLPEKERRTSRFRGLLQRTRAALRRDRDLEEGGAPMADEAQEDQAREVARLLFAYVPDLVSLQDAGGTPTLPDGLVPLCHLRMVEFVREEAKATIQAFAKEGVEIKLLSSDNTDKVAAVARQAGLAEGKDTPVRAISGPDLAGLDEEQFARTVAEYTAFGQLTPEQTGEIVQTLRGQGHHVAMVGDRGNHISALRNANLKITVQSGSQAALSVADIVLLDDSLAVMSAVLLAGQRIVNGLLDMLKLNLVQVCYLALFLTAAVFMGFPYAPKHGTFIALFTLSLPSTGLSMWAASGTVPASVMRDRLIHFALPAGLTVTALALGVHFSFRATTGNVEYAQLATAYIVTACGLLLVVFVQPPTKAWVGGDVLSGDSRPARLVVGLFILFVVIGFVPLAQRFLNVQSLQQLSDYGMIALIAGGWALVLRFIWRARPLEGPSNAPGLSP